MRRLLFAAALAACACTPDPEPLDPPPAGYVGEFVLARVDTHQPTQVDTFIFAEASFAVSDEDGALSLDAGSRAGLVEPLGGGSLDLIRRNFLGDIFYQRDPDTEPFPASAFVPEAAYDVWVSGTEIDGGVPSFTETAQVRAPGSFVVDAPDFDQTLIVDTATSLTITYTATGAQADRVLAVLVVSDGTTGSSIGVQGDDDGSLTIQASTFQGLGVGTGTLTFYRIFDGTFDLPVGGTATTRGMFGHTAFLEIQ